MSNLVVKGGRTTLILVTTLPSGSIRYTIFNDPGHKPPNPGISLTFRETLCHTIVVGKEK